MKYYAITRREVYEDVGNWGVTPEDLLNVNPDELWKELPELLADKEAKEDEDGVPLDTVVTWYRAAAAVRALAIIDEADWEELAKMIPRSLLYDCWLVAFDELGKRNDLTMFLDDLDEWDG